jgi:hypothetical protein
MKTNKLIGLLAITSLALAGGVFAQEANVTADVNVNANVNSGGPGMPPPGNRPPRPGFMNQIFGSFREERKDLRQDFQDDKADARGEFRDDMKARMEWRMGSTTGSTTMATPTPWKNYRENMKDARQDFRDGMKNLKGDMMGRMASLTEAQMASITAKLGITLEQLKLQLASGTPLREIIGDKISHEDMMKIMPPMMGTDTRSQFGDRRPQGFINSLRSLFFGGNRGEENGDGEGAQVEGNASVNASGNVNPGVGFGNFFRRLFNF